MTRIGKKEERKNVSPRKRRYKIEKKTGPKKDNLKNGYKEHENALKEEYAYIPKIK
ncbi:MAG: hypothetical protein K1060chlam5_00344 [Candidatus Anoxychlamydiales bacterium]|nr:hypothetical protein [Candidatus Anoxychlamydiales bacterium]